MTHRATPSRKRTGWLVVLGAYDPEFVDDIKSNVPSRDREWSPVLKAWLVKDTHSETLARLGVVLPKKDAETCGPK